MRPIRAVRLGTATALAALIACAPVTSAAAEAGSAHGKSHDKGQGRVITLIGRLAEQTRYPVNPDGVPAAQGDRTVVRSDLYDLDDNLVGETGGHCTTTRAANGGAEECVVTYTLPGGQITVQGMVFGFLNPGPPPSFDNAITGGTGEFDRARGSVHADTIGVGVRRFTITLR
ncbi:allene oxide cyclase barrel-like domain-containing protein [Streptomyces sp. NPDC003863]